jgi:DNA-binding NtrC family response regulator
VAAGRLRQDLFFALSIFPIRCEPLARRIEDIPYLARHFLDATTKRLRLPAARLTKGNIDTLQSYDWPGNVRELQNVIERAAILAQGGKLRLQFQEPVGGMPAPADRVLSDGDIRAIERNNLLSCLRRSQGRVAGVGGAAEILGIATTTVYSRIKSLQITKDEWQDTDPASQTA